MGVDGRDSTHAGLGIACMIRSSVECQPLLSHPTPRHSLHMLQHTGTDTNHAARSMEWRAGPQACSLTLLCMSWFSHLCQSPLIWGVLNHPGPTREPTAPEHDQHMPKIITAYQSHQHKAGSVGSASRQKTSHSRRPCSLPCLGTLALVWGVPHSLSTSSQLQLPHATCLQHWLANNMGGRGKLS